MPEAFYSAIDNYCERTGPEFWSEPLNAVTNVFFIAAGIAGLVLCRRHRADRYAHFLSWWLIVIGVGSASFHTFANGLTLFADILPIAAFIFLFTWYALSRFLGLGAGASAGITIVFHAATISMVAALPTSVETLTNGTIAYLPALLGMLFFGGWLAQRRHPAARYLLWAAAVFVVSAAFRSVDIAVCDALPVGTHFVWHSLNGLVLCILAAAAAIHGGKRPEAASA